ncbi:hypothetical protein BKA65DRAFT_277757 [Rhexocercosporidium sp. MPI-PUGE-AT-0058]|nr:hypothetical protein BKA65DRAFT_277757 [Rhexocercosporidium sp. MPI-PUGE-AT-0058]
MSSDHLTRLVGSGSNWDSIVSQGLLFKMTATQLTILTSVFTIAFAFLVARLFRVFCLVTFCMFIRQGSNEYQTDQVRVAVVNFRMPLHVIGQRFSWGRVAKGKGRVRIFALVWLAGAVVSLLLGLSIPVLISRLPVANGVAGGPNCALGLIPIDQGNLRSRTLFDAHLRYEQQNALVHTDATGYDYEGFSAAQVGYLKPRDTIEKSAVCPNHSTTTTCADGDALNFFGECWLEPSDLGVGNIDDLSFGVSIQCYCPPPDV